MPTAKLFFLCGKMAAGKSTLARMLAHREHAMLLVSDEWLGRLYPVEISTSRPSSRTRHASMTH